MNLARLVDEHYEAHGDYGSVFFEGRWHSTGETLERIRRFAGGLRELGVEPGDRVVVMLPNCPEVGISYWASWRIGAAVTPVIFLLPPAEVRRILEDAEAKVAITSSDLLPVLRTASEGIASLRHVVSIDGGEGTIAFSTVKAAEPAGVAERDGSDPAALLYTGGTTGASKGVVLSHHNLEWTARAAREGSEVEADHIGLLVLPLSHGFGLGVSILGVLSPSRSVLLRWFDVDAVLDAIERHRIQRLAVVPTMVQMLLTADLESRDLSSLTYITSGGAAMPEEVLRAWERRVPNCPILQGYGLTETSPTITVQRPSSVEDGTRKVGSVGRPIDGVEVRIVDDADRPLGPGEVGEVTARGPNVMRGYWRNPGATADAVRDGWFHTGDMGYLDADGDLFIVDRKKDLIIRGGFNVFPNDVEAALLESPQVLEAAVVARPSEKYGEEPVAFVSLAPGATVEDVTAYCEERLAKYKRPAEVRAVPAVPKTPVGKIDRKALRAELA